MLAAMVEDADELSGPQRAALLLMYLDHDTAKKVAVHLTRADLHEIGLAMATVNQVSESVIEFIVGEFVTDLNRTVMLPASGAEFALKVLPDLIEGEESIALGSSLRRALSTEFEQFINGRAPAAVAAALRDEHMQVQALAMLLMGPENAGKVLEEIDEEGRRRIVARMAKIEAVTGDAAEEVERAIRDALTTEASQQLSLAGVERAAKSLGRLEALDRQSVLDLIATDEPDLSEELRRRLFVFDDLAEVPDRSMQVLLRGVPREALVTALRGAKRKLLDAFTRNMSSRAARDLLEEIEVRGALPRKKVEAARDEIVESARRLADDGAIAMPGGGGDML